MSNCCNGTHSSRFLVRQKNPSNKPTESCASNNQRACRAPARKYNNVCSFPRASVGASFFAPKVYKYTKYTHPCVQSPLLARNNTKNTQFSSQIFAYIKKKY